MKTSMPSSQLCLIHTSESNESQPIVEMAHNTEKSTNKAPTSFSERVIVSLFNKFESGFLKITDGEDVYHFGDIYSEIRADIIIHDKSFYKKLLYRGDLGFAESYVEGDWTSPNLTALIRVFSRNLTTIESHEKRFSWPGKIIQRLRHHFINRNTQTGSRTNIAAHYDLSNELYKLFLDPHMQYSSAIFPNKLSTLEAAQENKMRMLCERLELCSDDHILEIGTGWGGLACFAAKHYGCHVTTTTISKAQHRLAKQRIASESLEDKVTLLLEDYRDLKGQYSKIVSVEMIEAVGHKFMPDYFRILDNLLKPGGKLLLQAITIEDQRYDSYRKNVDFIQRYIFPGGHLPSVSEICRHLKEQTNMRLNYLSDYSQHYADTLRHWNIRFMENQDKIEKLSFNDDFIRLWQYYFCYCEGAFRENAIGLAHIETIKSQHAK